MSKLGKEYIIEQSNLLNLKLEEEFIDYLYSKYSSKPRIKDILNKIAEREIEGYEFLSDYDIVDIGTKYFECEIWLMYDVILNLMRTKKYNKKMIAEYLGVNPTVMMSWVKYDKQFKQSIYKGVRGTSSTIANILYDKCLEGDLPSIKFYLTNVEPHEWKEKRSIEANIDSETKLSIYKGVIDDYNYLFSEDDVNNEGSN